MAVDERDPYTGYMTTGHEWNGIKELNTPVPRAVYFFLIVTALFAVVYWILMPAWPLGVTYTKGLLGIDQRNVVAESLKQAALERSVWTKRIEAGSFKDIQADPQIDGDGAADRPNAVRRQLRGVPWIERARGQGIPEPDDGVVAVGRRSRKHRGNHPRRHQFRASADQDIADDGVRARSDC